MELEPHEIVARGIAQAPEGRRIFPAMSVLENLQMGAVPTNGEFFDQDLSAPRPVPRLRERQHQRGGTLSGGEQQMLCIGRALWRARACFGRDFARARADAGQSRSSRRS